MKNINISDNHKLYNLHNIGKSIYLILLCYLHNFRENIIQSNCNT